MHNGKKLITDLIMYDTIVMVEWDICQTVHIRSMSMVICEKIHLSDLIINF